MTALAVGVAVGYYLGTEQGREKLEQARKLAVDTWNDPRVQEKVAGAQTRASGN
ncbi:MULTISPECIES: hypothetical protein [Isoptericola]|uniref:Uncharacterized protein n=1 Tax=Isoptericola sediminis TaxID=2733572 RepID=A0A849KD56_9MICO|nr:MULTISPECIES: hypothetical protein [Isoptericola]MDO8143240.1 hypothetical protein [Isoptericola sp. 178]MDO8147101.1 hypothetical protein [Isoptericola sp. b515]MDO8150584.1 hypothetical protein [Isoptericola sp. b408]NNU26483.1 hypothetical protein [Isoptericola sediminis]